MDNDQLKSVSLGILDTGDGRRIETVVWYVVCRLATKRLIDNGSMKTAATRAFL